MDRVPAL